MLLEYNKSTYKHWLGIRFNSTPYNPFRYEQGKDTNEECYNDGKEEQVSSYSLVVEVSYNCANYSDGNYLETINWS